MNSGTQGLRTALGIAWGVLAILAGSASADKNNRYEAPHAKVAPVIDGKVDSSWSKAPWDSIPYNYLTGTAAPTSDDFSGRYKVLWDSSKVYLLIEIRDDSIGDHYPDALTNYWDDDAVEIFLDENKNGGNHQYNFKAWAYHISTKVDPTDSLRHDVVDYGDDQNAHLYNSHLQVKRVQTGHVSIWEMSMSVYGEDYTQAGPNTALKLVGNKEMGFTVAYCDNDGGSSRENFQGSVNTSGHIANQGYINASCFGALKLVADTTAGVEKRRAPAGGKSSLRQGADGFRLDATVAQLVQVFGIDGSVVDSFKAFPGVTYGAIYPVGVYGVRAADGSEARFAKLR